MNLSIFDIDGTLTESVAVDEVCFVQAFRDMLGIERINTNWLDYHFQTDSGLALEICRNHLGRDPDDISCRPLMDDVNGSRAGANRIGRATDSSRVLCHEEAHPQGA
jgi:hypothetical protein